MPFTDILAQDHVIDHFKKAIETDHLSHAYLFTGQRGVGKTLFTKEFAKVLNCMNDKSDPCNSCHNCIRINANSHPDVSWIEIEEKAKFIKIENIRNLQNSAKLSPLESDYKIYIIADADMMNEEASNCLLKTLEEPSPNTIIVLIANSISSVKETIRSRCQIIRFHLLPSHIIENQLAGKSDADPDKIAWTSTFCNGSLGDALKLLDQNYYEINNNIVSRLTETGIDNLVFAEEIINSYLSTGESLEEKRQVFKGILNCILQFYRDLLIVKIRSRNNTRQKRITLFNADHEDAMRRYINYLTQEQIINIIDEILESIKFIGFNLNINLLVENIITSITFSNSKEN
ncbi:DNA polymerase III, gamma/tau subunits [Candidatus Scalindua japonica]|uniref:DNA polymerase III, gamma/tau subunits n=1 Tax=Candidatus Scalindua japonica TaxID=1284222 RepID=A0A286TUC5_9BACT|nr:DNA polymerase III subunit delta' [Candidatus Scalindua japonica]GAX59451.1 DNA polymerase III, gamma/tau subunits [Candidatus Scalindua japonica]